MTISLNGIWRYCPEDNPGFAATEYDDSAWRTMSIPQNWFLGGLDHHGTVWFRTSFQHHRRAGYTDIHFEGVDYFADVFLNGQHMGNHAGYFEPFSFDVTKTLRSGTNCLAVRVESPYETPGSDGWHLHKRLIKGVLNHHDCRPGGGWDSVGQSYNTGGIWNRINLRHHGDVTIEHMLLRADMDLHPPALHIEIAFKNRGPQQHTSLELACIPDNFKGSTMQAEYPLDLIEGENIHKFDMPVEDAHVWQPWDRGFPYLYNVTASLRLEKDTVRYASLFGFRSIQVEAGFQWYLNGERYFPRGSNYLPSQWLSETLFPDVINSNQHPFGGGPLALPDGGPALDFYTRDISLAKQANLNILRVHAHVLPSEFHEVCDRAGLLVWQDFALQWGYSDEPAVQSEAERQIKAMVTMLYNHPSIAAWCCHNESPWDAPWMAPKGGGRYDPSHNRDLDTRLETTVRALDPLRYIHRNSGTGDGHIYPGWYVGHWRDFKFIPAAPFVTEYGAQGLPVKENIRRMLPQYGEDAGFSELLAFKTWLESNRQVGATKKRMNEIGIAFRTYAERHRWKFLQEWIKGLVINMEQSVYAKTPSLESTPAVLHHARQVWEDWRFHDFQPAETFDNGISIGTTLEDFIANSQAYQAQLIQYATECYRRAGSGKVTGLFQFDFTDPWPAITWSVLDYWRAHKPAFDALRRSMQPVLPSFLLPELIGAGKAVLTTFCVINDMLSAYSASVCEWHLEGPLGDIASAEFPIDIPANSVSPGIKLTLPSMRAGKYRLSVTIHQGNQVLGENLYELLIH
jgi:hypothetical protein